MQHDTVRSAPAARPAASGSQVWMGGDNSAAVQGSSGDEGDTGDKGQNSAQSAGDSSGVPAGRLMLLVVVGAGLLSALALVRKRAGRVRPGPGR
ncbi:hypothetical protein OG909_27955 [Streptomyces sp. NBC_01754]|uniref:hypothetical protein n=1 Tax=Streptomyces sp. NBC_01754 TaxID=2975930 RepID=UPI002DD82952|nr:hypothetical protein [Streptomyces sp. NBC_01754]WSC95813.1 hypothetical protein OG909_27955 [Streptomyces sp. NBC_01754]